MPNSITGYDTRNISVAERQLPPRLPAFYNVWEELGFALFSYPSAVFFVFFLETGDLSGSVEESFVV